MEITHTISLVNCGSEPERCFAGTKKLRHFCSELGHLIAKITRRCVFVESNRWFCLHKPIHYRTKRRFSLGCHSPQVSKERQSLTSADRSCSRLTPVDALRNPKFQLRPHFQMLLSMPHSLRLPLSTFQPRKQCR